jgi:hypothetical protein
MTLSRRIMLLDSALTQLAEELGLTSWRAAELGLVTNAVRAA